MKTIYSIRKSPTGFTDHQMYYRTYIECESEQEYEDIKAKYNAQDVVVYAREYYDAHCWQGQHFDAIGFEVTVVNNYLCYHLYTYIKPNSITNRKEVKVVDYWWNGS